MPPSPWRGLALWVGTHFPMEDGLLLEKVHGPSLENIDCHIAQAMQNSHCFRFLGSDPYKEQNSGPGPGRGLSCVLSIDMPECEGSLCVSSCLYVLFH